MLLLPEIIVVPALLFGLNIKLARLVLFELDKCDNDAVVLV